MEFLCYLSLLFLLLPGACTSANTHPAPTETTMTDTLDYRSVAESRLGGSKIQYAFNEARTMVLCTNKESITAPAMVNAFRFVVILLKNNALVYEDQMANARVEWFNNTQLKITNYPGTIQVTPNKIRNYYLYDLETKQKVNPPSDKL